MRQVFFSGVEELLDGSLKSIEIIDNDRWQEYMTLINEGDTQEAKQLLADGIAQGWAEIVV